MSSPRVPSPTALSQLVAQSDDPIQTIRSWVATNPDGVQKTLIRAVHPEVASCLVRLNKRDQLVALVEQIETGGVKTITALMDLVPENLRSQSRDFIAVMSDRNRAANKFMVPLVVTGQPSFAR